MFSASNTTCSDCQAADQIGDLPHLTGESSHEFRNNRHDLRIAGIAARDAVGTVGWPTTEVGATAMKVAKLMNAIRKSSKNLKKTSRTFCRTPQTQWPLTIYRHVRVQLTVYGHVTWMITTILNVERFNLSIK
jgi:hypothetical protein